MSYGVIYCITNLKDNKKYIGMTTRSIEERFAEHIKTNSYIGKALRKHGVENFAIEQIDEANTKKELCENEIYWIEKHATFINGYNLTRGGEGVDNSDRIPVILNEKQKEFIEYIHEENKKDIDVNDKYQMMKTVLLNMINNYLNSERVSDKKNAAKLINRLKPIYKQSIEEANIIDFRELNSYL